MYYNIGEYSFRDICGLNQKRKVFEDFLDFLELSFWFMVRVFIWLVSIFVLIYVGFYQLYYIMVILVLYVGGDNFIFNIFFLVKINFFFCFYYQMFIVLLVNILFVRVLFFYLDGESLLLCKEYGIWALVDSFELSLEF